MVKRAKLIVTQPFTFIWRVISSFRANQGILLAGAVAYHTLLSIVPMFAIIVVGLSHFTDMQGLLDTTREYLKLVSPGQADALTQQLAAFLQNRNVIGLVGLGFLLFFSTLAFTVLENALSVIFFHRVAIHRRHFLVSAAMPYGFIFLLALGLLLVTLVSGTLHALDERTITLFNRSWTLSGDSTTIIYFSGLIGEVLLLTSIYMVMPLGRLVFRHALIGGVTATLLWELTRHFLVWYFSTLSFVNIIYGSFAATIIILVSLETAAMILLFGAQVIAEYERLDPTDAQNTDFSTV